MYQNYKSSTTFNKKVVLDKSPQKQPAIDLRKRGMSYSEIRKQILVPKSTLAYWLKDIKLSREQASRLNRKRIEAAKRGTKKKIESTRRAIEEIKRSSAKDIKEISKRELWLMGIMLYWRERFLHNNDNDLKRGVRFTSSDPYLIKLFLKWLVDVGHLDKKEIAFDLFIGLIKKNKSTKQKRATTCIDYWAKMTGFSKSSFKGVYIFKNKNSNKSDRNSNKPASKTRVINNKSKNGLLRIRVKASSMFARQIAGWIKGIQKYYWHE